MSVTNPSRHLGLTCPNEMSRMDLHHIWEPLSSLSIWSYPMCSETLCFQSVLFIWLPLKQCHCRAFTVDFYLFFFGLMKVRKMCLTLSLRPAVLECCGFDQVGTTVAAWSQTTRWGARSTLRPQAPTVGFVDWTIVWILTRWSLRCAVTSVLDRH